MEDIKEVEDQKVVGNGTELSKNGTEPIIETESDPCMGEQTDNKKSKPPEWLTNYRNRACEKTGLSKRALCVSLSAAVLIVLLFITVIALAASWPRTPHWQRYPICRTPECLQAAAQIREALNSSNSPCTNLNQWACGGWFSKYPLPKEKSLWNQKELILLKEAERVRNLLGTLKLPLRAGTVEWKLKHLYELCMNVDDIQNDGNGPLTDIIDELGGWYILRDSFNSDDFDARKVLTLLHEKHGSTPYFRISVEANPQTPNSNSIKISPSGLGLPDREYYYLERSLNVQEAYKELIRDVLMHMGAIRNEAEKFANDIFSYEKRIAEVTTKRSDLENPLANGFYFLSELEKTIMNIPFLDILVALYPEANITENTEVLISSFDYLTSISQIISTTDKRTTNGYLIWTLVRKYLPFLSKNFMDRYRTQLLGIEETEMRWETCSKLVVNIMGLATDSLNEHSFPLTSETRNVVNKTFQSILKVVQERIRPLKMESNSLYQHLQRKLDALKLQIGLPDELLNETYLKNFYSKLKIIKVHFFLSVKNGMMHNKYFDGQRILKPGFSDNILQYALSRRTEVKYISPDNAVFVPKILTQEPYLDSKYPRPVIYGRLGVEIANAVLSSVLPYDSFWAANGKMLTEHHTVINESLQTVEKVTNCLKSSISQLNLRLPDYIENQISLSTMKSLTAISIANQALLENSLNEEHIHQPSLEEFEDSSLFFLTQAQTLCSETTDQRKLSDSIINSKLPQETLMNFAWEQIPEFSISLKCPINENNMCLDRL